MTDNPVTLEAPEARQASEKGGFAFSPAFLIDHFRTCRLNNGPRTPQIRYDRASSCKSCDTEHVQRQSGQVGKRLWSVGCLHASTCCSSRTIPWRAELPVTSPQLLWGDGRQNTQPQRNTVKGLQEPAQTAWFSQPTLPFFLNSKKKKKLTLTFKHQQLCH